MKETDLPQNKLVLRAGGENQSATEPSHPVLNVLSIASIAYTRRDGKLLSHEGRNQHTANIHTADYMQKPDRG